MSQSTNVHHERLTLRGLDAAIRIIRDDARKVHRYGIGAHGVNATGEELRAVNEFLLMPTRALVEKLAAMGASKVEPPPATNNGST